MKNQLTKTLSSEDMIQNMLNGLNKTISDYSSIVSTLDVLNDYEVGGVLLTDEITIVEDLLSQMIDNSVINYALPNGEIVTVLEDTVNQKLIIGGVEWLDLNTYTVLSDSTISLLSGSLIDMDALIIGLSSTLQIDIITNLAAEMFATKSWSISGFTSLVNTYDMTLTDEARAAYSSFIQLGDKASALTFLTLLRETKNSLMGLTTDSDSSIKLDESKFVILGFYGQAVAEMISDALQFLTIALAFAIPHLGIPIMLFGTGLQALINSANLSQRSDLKWDVDNRTAIMPILISAEFTAIIDTSFHDVLIERGSIKLSFPGFEILIFTASSESGLIYQANAYLSLNFLMPVTRENGSISNSSRFINSLFEVDMGYSTLTNDYGPMFSLTIKNFYTFDPNDWFSAVAPDVSENELYLRLFTAMTLAVMNSYDFSSHTSKMHVYNTAIQNPGDISSVDELIGCTMALRSIQLNQFPSVNHIDASGVFLNNTLFLSEMSEKLINDVIPRVLSGNLLFNNDTGLAQWNYLGVPSHANLLANAINNANLIPGAFPTEQHFFTPQAYSNDALTAVLGAMFLTAITVIAAGRIVRGVKIRLAGRTQLRYDRIQNLRATAAASGLKSDYLKYNRAVSKFNIINSITGKSKIDATTGWTASATTSGVLADKIFNDGAVLDSISNKLDIL